jgi:hypothetical protein
VWLVGGAGVIFASLSLMVTRTMRDTDVYPAGDECHSYSRSSQCKSIMRLSDFLGASFLACDIR